MIKYSHHYKYCNSLAYSAKVEIKGRHNLIETFEWLKKHPDEVGKIEYYTPEMFKKQEDFEKKVEQMKIEIAKDAGGDPNRLPVFTGHSWGGNIGSYDPEKETISCIVKAPEWLNEIHGNWIIFFQDKKTGEVRLGLNGGHSTTTAEGRELLGGLTAKVQGLLTSKRIKQTALDKFMKISPDTTIKKVGSKLIIDVNVYLNDLTKAAGVISRHHDVPRATPATIPGQGGGGGKVFKPLSPSPFAPKPGFR